MFELGRIAIVIPRGASSLDLVRLQRWAARLRLAAPANVVSTLPG